MELTERETKVLVGVGQGLEIGEVAHRLQLSKRSVMYCLSDLRMKLEAQVETPIPTTTALAVRSAELGIFPLGWRLSEHGQLVRSARQAVRSSLGLSPDST